MSTVELVSLSEYGRRRGCTEGAVRRAVRDGRITLIGDKVDPVAADAQWARNTRPRASGRGQDDANLQPPSAEPARGNGQDVYWSAKGRREQAEAELAELRLAEETGRLVDRAALVGAHAKAAAAFRDSLLQIAARLAPVLAAEADQAKVRALLDEEHRRALEQFAGGGAIGSA